MALLIDGYNLLHVTGLFGPSFEASRHALLNFLATALDARERAAATVVFDAAHAPPGLPQHYDVEGIQVYYARGYDSADALLEELIADHGSPRKLTVVSSDHRVQRAAKKRRATAIDSHLWYHATFRRLQRRQRGTIDLPDVKPDTPLTKGEVEVWLREFGAGEIAEQVSEELLPSSGASPHSPKKKKRTSPKRVPKKRPASDVSMEPPPPKPPQPLRKAPAKGRRRPKNLGFGDIRNPFPPGYGEDVV